MVRSLWSAATGMQAQQIQVDTIANNISNINTTGYKTNQNEFKSLLYQELQTKSTSANGDDKPIASQVGLGVRAASITTMFTQGAFFESTDNFDFAISGDGFFAVKGNDGKTYYTRNGNFQLSIGTNGLTLTNTDGEPVLDTKGQPITFPKDISSSEITVSSEGEFFSLDEKGNPKSLNKTIGLYQFNNPSGLEKHDSSLYEVTAASGNAINESTATNIQKSTIAQGYLEGSNVQLADEMVNLIVAQRAYEANSKAITTTDEMMGQANQLKR